MSTLSKKEIEKEKRRNDILDATEALLKVKSVEDVTMDEIAERVDLSKGTLYLYFASKKELSLGIHNRALEKLVEKFARVLAEDLPGIELLGRLADEYVGYMVDNPRYMETFMHNEALLFPHGEKECISLSDMNLEAQKCHDNAIKMYSYLIRCIQVGISDKSISYEGDPKELAVVYWGGLRGMFHISYLAKKGFVLPTLEGVNLDFKSLFKRYIDLVYKALKKND